MTEIDRSTGDVLKHIEEFIDPAGFSTEVDSESEEAKYEDFESFKDYQESYPPIEVFNAEYSSDYSGERVGDGLNLKVVFENMVNIDEDEKTGRVEIITRYDAEGNLAEIETSVGGDTDIKSREELSDFISEEDYEFEMNNFDPKESVYGFNIGDYDEARFGQYYPFLHDKIGEGDYALLTYFRLESSINGEQFGFARIPMKVDTSKTEEYLSSKDAVKAALLPSQKAMDKMQLPPPETA